MAELHIRNLPPELHDRLREQAAADGRSMSVEAVAILQQALFPGDRSAAIDRLREIRTRNVLPSEAPPAEYLVRDDRDVGSPDHYQCGA